MARSGVSPVATLFEAAKSLRWTRIRADIVKCTEVEARLWEAMENLYRADLTSLEEAEHQAECVRQIAKRDSVSRQNVAKPQGGRPEGAIAKAARELPLKGKTQQARRKAIERGIKIAAISPEAKAAAKEAGLDDNRSVLRDIATLETSEEQLHKVQEIAKRKSLPKVKAPGRGIGPKKKVTRVASGLSSSAEAKAVRAALLDLYPPELKAALAQASPADRDWFLEKIRAMAEDDDDQEHSGEEEDDERAGTRDK
jgi:hypothetical protein